MRPARLPRAARSERAGSQSLRAWSQESVYWGSRRKKEGKGGEIYHKKSVKSAEFLHEKGGISIWPQLPSEATEASNENEFKTQSDVFLDGVRGTEQQPPPRGSPPTPPSPAAPQPRWAPRGPSPLAAAPAELRAGCLVQGNRGPGCLHLSPNGHFHSGPLALVHRGASCPPFPLENQRIQLEGFSGVLPHPRPHRVTVQAQ